MITYLLQHPFPFFDILALIPCFYDLNLSLLFDDIPLWTSLLSSIFETFSHLLFILYPFCFCYRLIDSVGIGVGTLSRHPASFEPGFTLVKYFITLKQRSVKLRGKKRSKPFILSPWRGLQPFCLLSVSSPRSLREAYCFPDRSHLWLALLTRAFSCCRFSVFL